VEFSFVAPMGFLLLLGIVVAGIIVTNFIQLTNEAREGARIAAICGAGPSVPMPDGSGTCSDVAIQNYITNHLVAVPGGSVTPAIYVCTPTQAASGLCSTQGSQGIANCYGQQGAIVEVDMSYDQPLYLPLVGSFFQTKPGVRTLKASAQATCE
jgi:hypothetical protein